MLKTLGLMLCLVLLLPATSSADHMVSNVTVVSGGGATASGGHRLLLSFGQPLAGSSRSDGHSFGAGVLPPVPVLLLSLIAESRGADIFLQWEIAGDVADHAGFHVYRENETGERDRLTSQLLYGETRYEYLDRDPPPGRVTYWLAEVDRAGGVIWHGPVTVDREAVVALPLLLRQNDPNPFRSATSISFQLPEPGPVVLAIYDVNGREIIRLADAVYPSGPHEAAWAARDAAGQQVPSGIYFYRLSTRSGIQTKKLVVLP